MAHSSPTTQHETIRLAVTGMHCASCSALIEEVLADVEGVSSVQVDLEGATGTVELDPAVVTTAQVCAVIGDLGYQATSIQEEAGT